MSTARLRVGPPCTRDQRHAASLDTVRHEQRSLEKRGHIYRTGLLTEGTHEADRLPCCSAGYCRPPNKPQRTRDTRYRVPPAQIPAGGIPAPGSHLECLTAKRAACRTRSSPWDMLSRLGVRRMPCSIAFPLAPTLGSIDSADSCLSLFVDFPATMAGSDFSWLCVIGFGSPAFPMRTALSQTASHEISRFPCRKCR
jgi:hypothetical protein